MNKLGFVTGVFCGVSVSMFLMALVMFVFSFFSLHRIDKVQDSQWRMLGELAVSVSSLHESSVDLGACVEHVSIQKGTMVKSNDK